MKQFITLLMLLAFLHIGNAFAQQPLTKVDKKKNQSSLDIKWGTKSHVIYCSEFHKTKPLYQIVAEHPVLENKSYPFTEYPDEEGRPIQTFKYTVEKDGSKYGNDPSIIQHKTGKNLGKAPIQNWAGQTATGFRPFDPSGAAGPNNYIQMINSTTYRIWDKSGNVLLTGTLGDLWSPATGNAGDPIVLYDKAADRWFLSQFGLPGNNNIYIAVSDGPNPVTASWYTYTYTCPDGPDYLKFSAWQDGYYMTANYAEKIYAFNRTKMLAGDASAEAVYQTYSPPNSGFFVPLPADASDGVMPGSNTPCPIFCYQDDAWGVSNDAINIYNASVNWSSLTMNITAAGSLPTNAFDASYDPNWDDVDQPGTTQKLDGIGGAMMFRAQWKTWSGYNTVVLNWGVQVTASQRGIFWCELRQDQGTGNWSVYQQGIYAPGTDHCWMGSIAMNDAGGIALCYAKANGSSTYMSLAYAGRLSCDPLGTLPIAEVIAQAGSGSQTSSNRDGDYAQTCLDPDGVTFWHTGEYMQSGGTAGTRVYSFQLPGSCAAPTVSNVTPSSLYEDRGKQITITGSDLSGCTFDIGGVAGIAASNDGSTAVVDFPAGNYTNGTLTVTNSSGSDNSQTVTVSTRNTIPVVAGAGVTSDDHPTIQSAADGLAAWYGTTAFSAGDLPGAKIIEVAAGTYAESITLNSGLTPDATNTLTIQPLAGNIVVVDATGNNYGFDLSTVNYVILTGFTVHSADLDNIYAQGNNVTISYNQTYGSVGGSGLKVETGTPFTVTNNLSYSNYNYGIQINSSNNTVKNNTLDNNGHSLTGTQILTYSFTGSVSIPDNGCPATVADAVINVPDNVTITNVRVLNMNITHTYDGDLEIYLIHPDATSVSLCLSRGGSGDDFINTNFDDAAGTAISAGAAPFTGTFTPETALSALDTKLSAGNWTLRVCDGASADLGTITGWQLEISYTANEEIGAGIYIGSVTGNTVENNISVAKTGSNSYYTLQSPANSVISDYNTYYTTNTSLFDYNGTIDNLGPMGANDLTSDPLFVGAGDYHIQSTADSYAGGEWPPLTASSGAWTTDGSNSPGLDTGNPSDSYTNEPASGNRINQGAYGNTVQASKSSSVVTFNWTGAANDNNWFNGGNWDTGTVPSAGDNVVIPNVTYQPIINNGISNIAQCNNLTIDAGASVTIDSDGYMTVASSITNNAGNAGLVINSDDTGTGSLIQNTSGGVDATVYRRLSSTARQWHMVSSPITAAPFSVFSSSTYLFEYNETVNDYWTGSYYDTGSADPWTTVSGNMVAVKGYIYNNFAETLTFTGQLNDNTVSSAINIAYTAANGNNIFDGWNLIGNPYTSAIDWDNAAVAHAAANLDDAIYIYDDVIHDYTSYVGGTGTNGGTQYIPAGQGFFVKANTSGTLNIGTAARIHNAQGFWKSNYTTPDNFLRLQISADPFNDEREYTDETVIRFSENATNSIDKSLDAYKLFSMEDYVPQIYTNLDGTEYSINTVKTFDEGTISLPLKVEQVNGDYKITVTEFNFGEYNVYLKDNLKNTTTEISLNDVIELTADASDSDTRFELIFEKSTSGTILAENASVTLFPNPNKGLFYLTAGNNYSCYNVNITTVLGQVVYNNNFFGNTSKIINLQNQSNGIYFVTIKFSDNSSITKKIVIE